MSGLPQRRPVVAHVITRYGRGGSEQRLRDMVASRPDMDHAVIAGEVADRERAIRDLAPARIEIQPRLGRSLGPRDALAFAAIVRHLRALDPTVVVTHQSKAGVLGRLAARRLGIPTIHSLSMATFGTGGHGRAGAVYRTIEQLLVPATSAYAVVGHDLASSYAEIGARPDQLEVIRSAARLPGPPADRRAAATTLRQAAGIGDTGPVLAFVGRLEATKNVLGLLDVLEAVHRRTGPPGPHLVVAGDGDQRAGLEREVAARGLGDRVHLLGHVDDPGVVFQGADVVLLVSRAEGLPQVLVQAVSAGTPFVAYRVSGASELLAAGASGDVVDWGDVDAAADAVVALLAGPPAPAVIDLTEWDPTVARARYAALLDRVGAQVPAPAP